MFTLRAFGLFVLCLMYTFDLHAAMPPAPQDLQRDSGPAMASPYVPIESWVYAAFDRLDVERYMDSALFSQRPWTRLECARLLDEAEEQTQDEPPSPEIATVLRALRQEFTPELRRLDGERNMEFQIESIDQRITSIAGKPLTDGYHFAETLVDDQGRPFAEGENLYTGISVRATAGRFAGYFHGELQRVPVAPIVPNAQAQQQIALADFTPQAQDGPASGFLRGRALEAYLSFMFSGNQVSFGRQSLWWGPARSGSTLFSNNAEPITMLRYDRVRPFELPGFLHALGPIRVQFMIGRLSGAQYVQADSMAFGTPGVALPDQPFLHGEKISFKFTPNFEFSVSRTVIFAGEGAPATIHSFLRSMFSTSTGAEASDPGDRRIAVDGRYRIPGLRNCLTGYFDGFSDDQPFPLAYPTESAWISGFALRCIPRAPRFTFRAEGLLAPHRNPAFPGFFYFNVHYLSGYTNNRQLIGSWIGREGDGEQLWATWQLSPRSSIELNGRDVKSSRDFLSGGSVRDLGISADLALGADWQLRLQEQAEWWRFPLLVSQTQHDNTFTLQLSYRPAARVP